MDRLLNVMTVASILLLVTVLFSVRRSHIRVEYSVSWLAASVILLLLSRSHAALAWMAKFLGLTYPPFVLLMIASGVFLVVFFRFSIIISKLKDSNIALAQRLAIVEFQMQNGHEKR